MPQRLVKVAKELNVGTATIVEYLHGTGFEIENKPTAKVTDEMYEKLVQEFSSSIAVKEKADQLILGGSRGGKKLDGETIVEEKPVVKPEKPPVSKAAEPEVKPEEVKTEPEVPATVAEDDKPRLKVVGKIDLDADKKKKEEARKRKEEEAKASEEKIKEPETTGSRSDDKEAGVEEDSGKRMSYGKDVEEDMVRAETPQLKGLKILGKIDTDKLEKKKQKKEKEEATEEPGRQ